MCANIEFKATTRKQRKSEQFHKSSNGFAKNCKMATFSVLGRRVGFVAFQKTKCVCRFYIKLKL